MSEPILEVRASWAKVAVVAAPAVFPLVLAALALLLTHPTGNGSAETRAIAAGIFALGALATGALFTGNLRGGPAMTMSREGLRHRRYTRATIPWHAMTAIRPSRRGGKLVVSIDADFAATYRGPRAHRLKAMFGFTNIHVGTRDLEADAADLAAAANAYRDAALGLAPPLVSAPDLPSRRRQRFLPYATVGLVAVLIVVFSVEVLTAPAPETATTLSAATMARDGGLARVLVAAGQWWRFLTAPLLHGGSGHLGGNVVALLLGGVLLERRIGHAWFLVIFAGGALAGGVASVLLDSPRIVTVGASGGISGLLAAVLVLAFLAPAAERWMLLNIAGRLLIGALVPTRAAQAAHVDFAAHFGGALGGLALGAVAAVLHDDEDARSQRRPLLRACAIVWVAATLGAFGLDAWVARSWRVEIVKAATPLVSAPATPSQLLERARLGSTSAETALKRQAEAGSTVAATLLGTLYDPTLDAARASESRTREALRWYRAAAERGVPAAQRGLGLLLAAARPGSPGDPVAGRRWLSQAAPLDPPAMRELALLYQRGLGGPRDATRGLALMEEAAERGDLQAEMLLAGVFDGEGASAAAQPGKAVHMLRLAAMRGDPAAERELARHLADGKGTPPNRAEAIEWFARAAANGDAAAQSALTRMAPSRAHQPWWGATQPTLGPTAGDDATAERMRCLEQRAGQAPTRMAPDLPSAFDAQLARSAALVRAYGRDPRVRYARAAAMYDADRDDIAEADLQCAVDDAATWNRFPSMQPLILTLLAKIKHDTGQDDDAERIVAPLCASARASVEAADLGAFCAARKTAGAAE